tara:strand:- start:140 stop:1987 length:1848 start_codon:yes stop_codon:yes gene_type:complete
LLNFFGQASIYLNLLLVLSFFFLYKKKFWSSNKYILITISISGFLPFIILVVAFLKSDFTILNVLTNSYINDPIFFKFASAWGSHEGSILLWVFIINLFLLIYVIQKKYEKAVIKNILLIEIGFIIYTILSSNPFVFISSSSDIQGLGLNPVLQNFLFVIHPPILFLGYICLIIPFSLAIFILSYEDFNKKYFIEIINWSKIAWFFLTLGIVLGSYWAYSELGWGGWWFWDPVENVSLIPWLLITALIHSTNVSIKKNELKIWSLNLCLYGFISCIFGTFLVRSNLIISVHSFASDPLRGFYLLAIVAYLLFYTFYLNLKSINLFNQDRFNILSRESFLLLNNIFFISASLTVFIGTIYPLFSEIVYGQQISVGAPYYNFTFNILLAPAVLLMALAPQLSWGKNKINKLSLFKTLGLSLVLSIVILFFFKNIYFSLATFIASPIILVSVFSFQKIIKVKNINYFGQWLAHLSIAFFILSAVFTEQFDRDFNVKFDKTSDTTQIINNNLIITINNIKNYTFKNHDKIIVNLTINNSNKIMELTPSKNIYKPSGQITTEVSKSNFYFDQFYSTINSIKDDEIILNIVHKPMINFLWLSTILLILGISLSLFRKKHYE